MIKFKNYLDAQKIVYREDCTLKELTTFKVGGKADLVVYPETAEQCRKIISYTKENQIKVVYLGNGSNILGDDEGCRFVLLKTDRLNRMHLNPEGILTVEAGVRLVKVSSFALQNGLTGLEFAHGIPGTMGGAIFMNAGAYGGSMHQVVLRTHYLDGSGVMHTICNREHCFTYRHSTFMDHPDFLILSTEIQLKNGDKNLISAKIKDFQQRRMEKQPLEFPSAGSTFKRPEGYYAGQLIQDAGLRGFRIGDAQVSEKHCGFVINRGSATSEDIKKLIDHIQKEVLNQFGVELKREVQFLDVE